MLGQAGEFYNALTKKYTMLFGTIFNDIWISRSDGTTKTQDFKVPLGFGPREKALGREKEDPDALRDRGLILPRMAYELTGWNYDESRSLNPAGINRVLNNSVANAVLNPVPYNLEFELYIRTKTLEDGYKILEQIIPFFRPDLTISAHLLDNLPEYKKDIAIVLNSVSHIDTYEGAQEERRVLVWTLSFTLRGYYFTATTTPKVIKFATVNVYPDLVVTPSYETVETYPGMTANGTPTTDPTQTVPWSTINEDDNWDYIVIVSDVNE